MNFCEAMYKVGGMGGEARCGVFKTILHDPNGVL